MLPLVLCCIFFNAGKKFADFSIFSNSMCRPGNLSSDLQQTAADIPVMPFL